MAKFRRYKTGDRGLSVADTNLRADWLEALSGISGPEMLVSQSGVNFRKRHREFPLILVKPTDPEAGGGKYAGYEWRPPPDGISVTTDLNEDELGQLGNTYTILYLPELGTSEHALLDAEEEYFVAWKLPILSSTGQPVALIISGGAAVEAPVRCVITGDATGGGWYTAKSLTGTGPSPGWGTTTFVLGQIGAAAAADDCIVGNLSELQYGTHRYPAGVYTLGTVIGRMVDGAYDGYKIVIAESFWGRPTGSAVGTLGTAGEGAEAADTDAWDYDESLDLDLTMQTRVAYNDSGDEILYGFYRTLKFRDGLLVEVTAETQYTIDAPGECEPVASSGIDDGIWA